MPTEYLLGGGIRGRLSSQHVLIQTWWYYSFYYSEKNRGHFGKMRLKMTFGTLTLVTWSNLVQWHSMTEKNSFSQPDVSKTYSKVTSSHPIINQLQNSPFGCTGHGICPWNARLWEKIFSIFFFGIAKNDTPIERARRDLFKTVLKVENEGLEGDLWNFLTPKFPDFP